MLEMKGLLNYWKIMILRPCKKTSKNYPLFANDFFMKRAWPFMNTVLNVALDIEHYWGGVEFAPGRGQIHLHMLGIAKVKAYLNDFYNAKIMEDKVIVVDKYAREKLDMVANIDIKDDNRHYFPIHPYSELSRKFFEVTDGEEYARLLCQDCMCHHCNRFCMQDNKKNKPRTCCVGFGDEANYG